MRCEDCEYIDGCSLREIATDITGCTGHSKRRKLKSDEVICWQCRSTVNKNRAFQDKNYKDIWVCFNCY